MNDLPSVIKHSKICLYADNVKLYKSISSVQDINDLLSDINNFSAWCNSWSLKINLKECTVTDFGPASTYPLPCPYVLDGNTIVNSDSYKD